MNLVSQSKLDIIYCTTCGGKEVILVDFTHTQCKTCGWCKTRMIDAGDYEEMLKKDYDTVL